MKLTKVCAVAITGFAMAMDMVGLEEIPHIDPDYEGVPGSDEVEVREKPGVLPPDLQPSKPAFYVLTLKPKALVTEKIGYPVLSFYVDEQTRKESYWYGEDHNMRGAEPDLQKLREDLDVKLSLPTQQLETVIAELKHGHTVAIGYEMPGDPDLLPMGSFSDSRSTPEGYHIDLPRCVCLMPPGIACEEPNNEDTPKPPAITSPPQKAMEEAFRDKLLRVINKKLQEVGSSISKPSPQRSLRQFSHAALKSFGMVLERPGRVKVPGSR